MPRRGIVSADSNDAAGASFTPTSGSGEKSLWDPNIWTPIPANDAAAGTCYELTCGGVLSTRTTTPGTLQIVGRLGTSSTPGSNKSVGASTAVTMIASLVNVPWFSKLQFFYKTVTDVQTSTGAANGLFVLGNLTTAAGTLIVFGSNAVSTIDTTIEQGLSITTTFSQATTSTATVQWAHLRTLN